MRNTLRKLANHLGITKIGRKYRQEQRCQALSSQVRILDEVYGLTRSCRERRPVALDGNPLPWFTYPSIEYLSQLDFSESDIFEFGCGYGSRFWAGRSRSVTAVENDDTWLAEVKSLATKNLTIHFESEKNRYVNKIGDSHDGYDLIIIDGDYRLDCIAPSLRKMKDGGAIILDNSDWFPQASTMLREAGLIQIDFFGFGPGLPYAWCTSLFLTAGYKFRTTNNRQPTFALGGIVQTKNENGRC